MSMKFNEMKKMLGKIKGSPSPKKRRLMSDAELRAFYYAVLHIAAFERGNRQRAQEMARLVMAEMLRRGM